eukprot:472983-Prorocentrum_minimum.AAC.1
MDEAWFGAQRPVGNGADSAPEAEPAHAERANGPDSGPGQILDQIPVQILDQAWYGTQGPTSADSAPTEAPEQVDLAPGAEPAQILDHPGGEPVQILDQAWYGTPASAPAEAPEQVDLVPGAEPAQILDQAWYGTQGPTSPNSGPAEALTQVNLAPGGDPVQILDHPGAEPAQILDQAWYGKPVRKSWSWSSRLSLDHGVIDRAWCGVHPGDPAGAAGAEARVHPGDPAGVESRVHPEDPEDPTGAVGAAGAEAEAERVHRKESRKHPLRSANEAPAP